VSEADEIGLGSVWIAERPNTKDIGVMSGITATQTKRMGIASGLSSDLPLRHPLVVAGYASTMAGQWSRLGALATRARLLQVQIGDKFRHFRRLEDRTALVLSRCPESPDSSAGQPA
jgi:hypothetical protein